MPSTTSRVVSIDLASSTVMVPSLPTLSIASAMISPMVLSQLAETVATCAISSLSLTFLAIFAELGDGGFDGLVDAALKRDRVRAGGDVLQTFVVDRFGENGRGGGAVAGDVAGLAGDFAHQLGAHVFVRVFEFDFLGDGDAVFGDGRGAEFLVENDVAAFRSEGRFDGRASFSTPRRSACRAASSNMSCLAAIDFLEFLVG